MGDVGDMYAHLVVPVLKPAERERVVEVLGVGRVDGEGEAVAEILAPLEVFGAYLVGNLVGGVLHLGFETVRQVEFGEDGVHLGVVEPGHSEHVADVAEGVVLSPAPAFDDCGDLHSGLGAFGGGLCGIDRDVVGHGAALHEHPRLVSGGMVYADEGSAGALEYLHHFAFAAALAVACGLVSGHHHLHDVAVEGVAGLGRLHEDVVVLTFYDHENIPFAGHLNLAGELGQGLAGLLLLPALPHLLAAFAELLLHNQRKVSK